jgi:hypothetical protein
MRKYYEKTGFEVDKYFLLEHKLKELDPWIVSSMEHHLEEGEVAAEKKEVRPSN